MNEIEGNTRNSEEFIITLRSNQPPHSQLTLDGSSGRLEYESHSCCLTPVETRLAWLLFENPRRTFAPHEIAKQVWGYDETWANTQVVYTTMSRLRKKIDTIQASQFLTVRRGFGYRANGHLYLEEAFTETAQTTEIPAVDEPI